MKRFLVLLCCFLMPLVMACNCNDSYRQKMIEYYTVDNNYVELNGKIIEIQNDRVLYIKILTEDHNFPKYKDNIIPFMFYTSLVSDYNIGEGDNITFISAPEYFYDGHYLPIVALSKDEDQCLIFETGKSEYLKWIREDF